MVDNYTAIDDLVQKYKSSQIKADSVSASKESEPINLENVEIKEVVELETEEDIKPFIFPRRETIELPPDLKKLGLQATSNSQFSSYQNIRLPLSDDKVVVGLKEPVTSSKRWLATLAEYILAKANLSLKVVKGKVNRVLRKQS